SPAGSGFAIIRRLSPEVPPAPESDRNGEGDDENVDAEDWEEGHRKPEDIQNEAVTAGEGKIDNSGEDEELPFPEFEPKSLLIFGQTHRPRCWCLAMITWPYPFPPFWTE